MKADVREIFATLTQAAAETAVAVFVDGCEARYPMAKTCLTGDRDVLLAFFDSTAEQEDTCARSTQSCPLSHESPIYSSHQSALPFTTDELVVFKLVMATAGRWNLLPRVVAGATFEDGIELIDHPPDRVA